MKRMRRSIRNVDFFSGMHPAMEDMKVDLHGKTCAESEIIVDAMLSSLKSGEKLLVVHGKGTGKLSSHMRAWLARHSLVKRVMFGEDEGYPGKDGVCMAVKK